MNFTVHRRIKEASSVEGSPNRALVGKVGGTELCLEKDILTIWLGICEE